MIKALVIVLSIALAIIGVLISTNNDTIDLNHDTFGSPIPWPVYIIATKLMSFAEEIPKLIIPAPILLIRKQQAYHTTRAIITVARFNIADHIGLNELSTDELAELEGLNSDNLCRVLRYLAFEGVFSEVKNKKCTFKNNRLSSYLMEKHVNSQKSMAIQQGVEYKLFDNLDQIVKTGKSDGYSYMLNIFEKDQSLRENFAKFMKATSMLSTWAIVDDFDLAKEGINSMADIGGSLGHMLHLFMKHNQNLTGVVFDLPNIITQAEEEWSTNESMKKYKDRVSLIGGDFFKSIPFIDPITKKPIDAYFLRSILHDWSDEDCIKILKNIRKASGSNTKLVLAEMALYEPINEVSMHIDLVMITISGKERNKEQFEHLFEASGFKLERIIQLRSPYSITIATTV